jgi:hypothetical protein
MPENASPAEPTPEEEPQQVTDLLVNMFLRQLGHRKEYDQIYAARGLLKPPVTQAGNLNNPLVQAEMRELAGYVTEELYEAICQLKNKPWAQTARSTDSDDFYKELADAWHFWLEFMIFAGMTPDVIAKYYFQKSVVNDDRRASGY